MNPYGRALFYVCTETGESVAEKLTREGLGKAWEGDGQHRELLMGVENVRRGMATEGYRWYSAWSCYKNSRVRRISCPSSVGRSCPTYSIMWRFDWSRDRRATLQGLPTIPSGTVARGWWFEVEVHAICPILPLLEVFQEAAVVTFGASVGHSLPLSRRLRVVDCLFIRYARLNFYDSLNFSPV